MGAAAASVFVVRRGGGALFPFARPVDECGLGAGTFGSYRAGTLAALGLPAARTCDLDDAIAGPALVLADDVWITKRALDGFLRAARSSSSSSSSSSVRFALPPAATAALARFFALMDVDTHADGRAAFDVAFVPAGETTTARALFSLDEARWRCPPYRDIPLEVPVPRHVLRCARPLGAGAGATDVDADASTWRLPLTSTIAMRVRHWVHVLRAGHLMPQVALLERASSSPLSTSVRLALAAVDTALSLRPSRARLLIALKRRMSFFGKGVVVHPTAIVEASVLEDGVHVGAHAYVHGSVLGAGTIVEQRAHVSGSCLGPRTFVSLNSSLSACVTFGDTDACINGVQACVIAERCALTSFCHPLDLSPTGEVKVDDGGALRAVGPLPCGVAFGAGVFLGANVTVAAGRAIPAGVRVVDDPARAVVRVAADTAAGLYAVDNGALRALEPLQPRHT